MAFLRNILNAKKVKLNKIHQRTKQGNQPFLIHSQLELQELGESKFQPKYWSYTQYTYDKIICDNCNTTFADQDDQTKLKFSLRYEIGRLLASSKNQADVNQAKYRMVDTQIAHHALEFFGHIIGCKVTNTHDNQIEQRTKDWLTPSCVVPHNVVSLEMLPRLLQLQQKDATLIPELTRITENSTEEEKITILRTLLSEALQEYDERKIRLRLYILARSRMHSILDNLAYLTFTIIFSMRGPNFTDQAISRRVNALADIYEEADYVVTQEALREMYNILNYQVSEGLDIITLISVFQTFLSRVFPNNVILSPLISQLQFSGMTIIHLICQAFTNFSNIGWSHLFKTIPVLKTEMELATTYLNLLKANPYSGLFERGISTTFPNLGYFCSHLMFELGGMTTLSALKGIYEGKGGVTAKLQLDNYLEGLKSKIREMTISVPSQDEIDGLDGSNLLELGYYKDLIVKFLTETATPEEETRGGEDEPDLGESSSRKRKPSESPDSHDDESDDDRPPRGPSKSERRYISRPRTPSVTSQSSRHSTRPSSARHREPKDTGRRVKKSSRIDDSVSRERRPEIIGETSGVSIGVPMETTPQELAQLSETFPPGSIIINLSTSDDEMPDEQTLTKSEMNIYNKSLEMSQGFLRCSADVREYLSLIKQEPDKTPFGIRLQFNNYISEIVCFRHKTPSFITPSMQVRAFGRFLEGLVLSSETITKDVLITSPVYFQMKDYTDLLGVLNLRAFDCITVLQPN